ncbi:hypothetical protein [Ruegeria sp.]|uniref:hypothetical protein n=1 Tax=Ruegeria sp. TaxID=1879320 RepID=UPI002313C78D|nr:hypothetical protein [Ruegeria sp.]MDA7966901.1 hypothetical protein [Ruegeria sp.]
MIWKTDTHQFTATICQRTGKTCPALAQVARAAVQAIATAAPATTAEFEVEGTADLTHCTQGCTARFQARPDRVRVYCGADPEVNGDCLNDYAELMFGSAFTTLPSHAISTPPCAMLQAEILAPRDPTPVESHATA